MVTEREHGQRLQHPEGAFATTRGAFAAVVAMSLLLQPATVFACPVCFQMADSAEAQGVRAAVYVLVGVTAAVLGGVGAFLVRTWRRMNAAGDVPLDPRDEGRP